MDTASHTSHHKIFLALGSNLGDRLANLQNTIRALPPEVQVTAQSPVYETPPWGYQDQPVFLNQVAAAQTALLPEELLRYLKDLEAELGRKPTFHYGPRQIDIDILFYDDLVYHSGDLVIPHPRLSERAFVLVPLADLAPQLRHPVSGESIQEMLARVDSSQISLYNPVE